MICNMLKSKKLKCLICFLNWGSCWCCMLINIFLQQVQRISHHKKHDVEGSLEFLNLRDFTSLFILTFQMKRTPKLDEKVRNLFLSAMTRILKAISCIIPVMRGFWLIEMWTLMKTLQGIGMSRMRRITFYLYLKKNLSQIIVSVFVAPPNSSTSIHSGVSPQTSSFILSILFV